MRLGIANRIVVVEFNSDYKFDLSINVDSDFNDINRVADRDFAIKLIYFRYKSIKIDLFQKSSNLIKNGGI